MKVMVGKAIIEIRIYDNKLVVFRPGGLPLGITVADLYKPHSSALRNKGVAGIFLRY